MKWSFSLLCVLGGHALLLSGAVVGILDRFDDGFIDPDMWLVEWQAYPYRYPEEANGHLEIHLDGADVPDNLAGVTTKMMLPVDHDFRVQVSFNASECERESGMVLSLYNADVSGLAKLHQSAYMANVNVMPDGRQWRAGHSQVAFGEGASRSEPTTADRGTLFITYEDGIAHLSHRGYGSSNALLSAKVGIWTSGCTRLCVGLHAFSYPAVLSGGGAYFDDFLIEGVPDSSAGVIVTPPEPAFGTPEWFEQWRQEHTLVTPADPADGLPGFEVVHTPWSDVSTVKEGISQVSIAPARPTSEDDVVARVAGWKTDSRCEVDYTTVNRAGNDVRLDVYWHLRPTPTQGQGLAVRPGSLSQQNLYTETQQSATVTVYDVPHFEGAPYQVTESLGTFSPGAYTLYVTNHGEVPGSTSMTFTVRDAPPTVGFHKQGTDNPWSWLLSH